MNPPYLLVNKSDFSLDFKLDAPIPPGEYIVSAEDSYTHATEMQFQVMTFSGDVIASLEAELINEDISYPTIYVNQIQTDSNQLLIEVDGKSTKELYAFDLQTAAAVGIEITCETLIGTALGAEYLAFSCLDDLFTWHFVSISDPLTNYSIHIPMPNDYFAATWVGTNEILFKGQFEAFCLGSIPNWEPICEDSSYWAGRLATDVKLLEIRKGHSYNPTSIGALSIECLRSDQPSCDPVMIENPFNDPQRGIIVPLSSSWLPGTTSILYLVVIDYDLSTNAADETELWLATYPEGTIAKIDVLEGEFVLAELGFPDAPAIWLPSGKEVVLNALNDLVIYNIETGEQRSIGYPGKVLGTITIE
jgi:hypothetical protein